VTALVAVEGVLLGSSFSGVSGATLAPPRLAPRESCAGLLLNMSCAGLLHDEGPPERSREGGGTRGGGD